MRAGAGYTTAMHVVNIALRDDGKVHVGRSTVRACVMRLNPLVTAISPHNQAGSDEWAKARARWATQLLLRLKLFVLRAIARFYDPSGADRDIL